MVGTILWHDEEEEEAEERRREEEGGNQNQLLKSGRNEHETWFELAAELVSERKINRVPAREVYLHLPHWLEQRTASIHRLLG